MFLSSRCYAFCVKPVKITAVFSDNSSPQNVSAACCHGRYRQCSHHSHRHHHLGEDCTLDNVILCAYIYGGLIWVHKVVQSS